MTFWTADNLILTCHFRWFGFDSIVQLRTAEVHFSPNIPQYEKRPDYSKVIPSLPKQVVSPLKSHSLCYSTWSQLSISESFLSALQNKQVSLMPPFAPSPLPFLSPSVFPSLPVKAAHSQVDGRHQKGWVRGIWDKCVRVISVESDVSLRACLWSYQQPGDNEWCRRKDNRGKHPGAAWQCGKVTIEQEYTGAEGSSGWVWAGSPTHVLSFKLCFCLPDAPSLHSPFSSCPIIPYM